MSENHQLTWVMDEINIKREADQNLIFKEIEKSGMISYAAISSKKTIKES